MRGVGKKAHSINYKYGLYICGTKPSKRLVYMDVTLEELLMSNATYSRILGLSTVLGLLLAALVGMVPDASGESLVTLKVVVKNQNLDPVTEATVYCVNVHSGAEYDLYSNGGGKFEADVVPGTYEVFVNARGYREPVEPTVVYQLTSLNMDVPTLIILEQMSNEGKLEIRVVGEMEGVKMHVFHEGSHLETSTTPKGYGNISAPYGDLHVLFVNPGNLTYSMNILLDGMNSPYRENITLEKEPTTNEGSYRIMGQVKSGKAFVPYLEVHLWDDMNQHLVPITRTDDGAISIPAYNSTFGLLVEAENYEPLWMDDIDLTEGSGNDHYGDQNTIYNMTPVENQEKKHTTVDLTVKGVDMPVMTTDWTLDANSDIWGSYNDFGTPRMQISDDFYTPGWEEAQEADVTMIEGKLVEYGPAYLSTGDFLLINDISLTWNKEYTVRTTGLNGSVFEAANPHIHMEANYTTSKDLDWEDGDDITVEIKSLLENEEVLIKLPSDYEIMGNYEDDEAVIEPGKAYEILVKDVPIEFTAKRSEKPEAKLYMVNSGDFYEVEEKKYIVNLDENITLSGASSYDPVGEIEKYTWNLQGAKLIEPEDPADLPDSEEVIIQFTKNQLKYLNVTLTVEDRSGLTSIDWIEILPDSMDPILPDPYTMRIEGTEENVTDTVDEDVKVVFNATGAKDNDPNDGSGPSGVIADYVWIFGDEGVPMNGEVVTYAFPDPGVYNISLKIVDAAGNDLDLENRTLTVKDVTSPMAVIVPFGDVNQGDVVEFNGTQSYDSRTSGSLYDAILEYKWTFEYNDVNRTLYGNVVNYTFEIPGEYIINLTVKDGANLTGWVEKPLMVRGPDLTVRDMIFSDPNENDMNEGERTKISIVVANDGFVDCPKNWTIRVTDNGKGIKTETVENVISPGGLYYFNFSYELKKDEREFKVVLDWDETGGDGEVAEQNEDNNEFSTTVKVEPKEPWFHWWYLLILLAVILVIYVVYMKYTRGEWGYEPVVNWWNRRNA